MRVKDSRGFSLIELMVAIAIVSVVLIAIVGVFIRSSRLYTLENARAALQQELRASLEIMAREVRMAVYDPKRTGVFKVEKATSTHFRFTRDLDEDGVVDPNPAFPDCEVLSFRYSTANQSVMIICGEGTGSQDPETLVGGTEIQVTSLTFDYKNDNGQSTTFRPDIRGVEVLMTAEIPAGSAGMETRTYTSYIGLRNTGPNSSI